MKKLASYIQPASMTWWAGIVLIVSAFLRIYDLEIAGLTPLVRPIIDVFYGSSPGLLIAIGVGLIGLGGKLERLNFRL